MVPFFLYFAHRNVHGPYAPNERFKGKSEIGVYGDFLLELDWSVGEILNTIDGLNLANDTLVFFSSDNGALWPQADIKRYDHRANGPLAGGKARPQEGGPPVRSQGRRRQRVAGFVEPGLGELGSAGG